MSQSLLVQALQRRPTPRPPIWLMRQAGRYLPEYRAVRANFPDFMEFCLNSEAATEVTLQPITRFNMDAAIIFADILTIPHALGHAVTFRKDYGPHVEPVTRPEQVTAMEACLPALTEVLAPVSATIRHTRAALPPQKAVIGFSGGPFTLATYMLDEKPSQGIPNTLAFAAEHPGPFAHLISTLTQAVIAYLSSQAHAGADALQVFESWAVACPPTLWEEAVHRPLTAIAETLHATFPFTPVILFPRGAGPEELEAFTRHSGVSGLSLSTETPLAFAVETLQPHTAIQGNLDPLLLTRESATPMLEATRAILQSATQKPGLVFNLGHGLTPRTHIPHVEKLVAEVQGWQNPQG